MADAAGDDAAKDEAKGSGPSGEGVSDASAHAAHAARQRDAGAATQQGGPGIPELLPVTLPDLSTMHASLQEQLRAAHASVMSELQRPSASPVAVANAYGNLGKLFKEYGITIATPLTAANGMMAELQGGN